MAKINNRTVYPLDILVSLSDSLTGTDEDSPDRKTKNYLIRAILSLFNEANQTGPLPVMYKLDLVKDFSVENGLFNTINDELQPNLITGFKINKFNDEGVDLSDVFNVLKANKTSFSFGFKITGNPNFINNYKITNVTDLLDSNTNTIGFFVEVLINNTIFKNNFADQQIYNLNLNSSSGIGGSAQTTVAIPVVGTSLGKYSDGETIPIATSLDELITDLAQKLVLPTFISPIATLTGSVAPNNNTEVGTSITSLLTTVLAINDGGAANNYNFFKDNISIQNGVSNTKSETFVLGVTPFLYKNTVSYDAGSGTKNDSLGSPVANTIIAGNVDSNTLSFRGYYKIFFGPITTPANSSVTVRALANSRFENAGNVFNLATGSTELNFQFWLPTGTNLVSVIDLDALNANITSSYVSSALSVNDAGGNPIVGTLYTMTQGVPYGTSHNHQITIN